MKIRLTDFAAVLLLAAAVWIVAGKGCDIPLPGPEPPIPDNAVDMSGVFESPADAHAAGVLLEVLAEYIEPDERFTDVSQLADVLKRAGALRFKGHALGDAFAMRAGAVMRESLGEYPGPLDRRKAADTLRRLAAGCEKEAR